MTLSKTELIDRWLPFYEAAHAHAEISEAETWTTDAIEGALSALGVETQRFSPTGTTAVIRNGEGPVIAFRADIDGLPVTENTGLSYASQQQTEYGGRATGTMHACGHDTHFTSALAATDFLMQHREAWSGTLILLFQPAEETGSGARLMLDGGVWDALPKPDMVIGQHVMPLPAGHVALKPQNLMSMANTYTVTVNGKQAHGSQPDASIDPIVAAAHMIVRLQTVVSRETHIAGGVVVTVGSIHAGSAPNIIPDTAEFTINIRTPDEAVRERTLAAVHRIVEAEAAASGATVDIVPLNAFPRCFNDPAATARVTSLLEEAFGDRGVIPLDRALPGSEDVGAFADAIDVPLVYWFFGGFPAEDFADGGSPAGNHSPEFAPNGKLALSTGVTAAVSVLLGLLQAES